MKNTRPDLIKLRNSIESRISPVSFKKTWCTIMCMGALLFDSLAKVYITYVKISDLTNSKNLVLF